MRRSGAEQVRSTYEVPGAQSTSGIDLVRCGIALLLSTAFFGCFLAVHDVPLVAFEPGLNLYQLVKLVAVLPMNVH